MARKRLEDYDFNRALTASAEFDMETYLVSMERGVDLIQLQLMRMIRINSLIDDHGLLAPTEDGYLVVREGDSIKVVLSILKSLRRHYILPFSTWNRDSWKVFGSLIYELQTFGKIRISLYPPELYKRGENPPP